MCRTLKLVVDYFFSNLACFCRVFRLLKISRNGQRIHYSSKTVWNSEYIHAVRALMTSMCSFFAEGVLCTLADDFTAWPDLHGDFPAACCMSSIHTEFFFFRTLEYSYYYYFVCVTAYDHVGIFIAKLWATSRSLGTLTYRLIIIIIIILIIIIIIISSSSSSSSSNVIIISIHILIVLKNTVLPVHMVLIIMLASYCQPWRDVLLLLRCRALFS